MVRAFSIISAGQCELAVFNGDLSSMAEEGLSLF